MSQGIPRTWLNRLAVLLLVFLVLVTLYPVLTYGFTGSETFRVLANYRVDGVSDLPDILTRPYMIRSPSADPQQYYRPVTALSFALDYHLWGLNALGFHLLDLLAHLGITVLVYLLVGHLTEGRVSMALMAGLLYVLHPLVGAVVPSIIRRGDLLAALGYMTAFYAFLRARGSSRSAGWTILSLGAYILSLGSKEIAVILPVLLLMHVLLLEVRPAGCKRRFLRAAKAVLPHLAVTGVYLGVWFYVTRGGRFLRGVFFGPIVRETSWDTLGFIVSENLRRNIAGSYLLYLFYPVVQAAGYLEEALNPSGPASAVLLALGGAAVLLLVWPVQRAWGNLRRDRLGAGLRLLLGLVVVSSLLFLCLYPLTEAWIRAAISQAYHHPDGSWLAGLMESQHRLPVDHYHRRARSLVTGIGLTGLLGGLAVLAAWDLLGRLPETIARRRIRLMAFFGIWCLIPMAVHVLALMVPTWRAYHGLFGLAGLAALGGDGWVGGLRRRFRQLSGGIVSRLTKAVLNMGSTSLLSVFLAVSLLVTSPLFGLPDFWSLSSRVRGNYLDGLQETLSGLPPGTVVEVSNFPDLGSTPPGRAHMALRPRDMLALLRPDLEVSVRRDHNPRIGLDRMRTCCAFRFDRRTLAPGRQRLTVYWDGASRRSAGEDAGSNR